jgi:hypothetical protein
VLAGLFDMLTLRALGRRADQRTWSLCSEGGFLRKVAHLGLTAFYHYPALDAEVDQIIVLEAYCLPQVYRVWNRGYTPESFAPLLERTGSQVIRTEGVKPGGKGRSLRASHTRRRPTPYSKLAVLRRSKCTNLR